MKAKDFWNVLCEYKDYRFFSGTACLGLVDLYKKMNRSIMLYVPAVDDLSSLGLVNGAYYSGTKVAIIIQLSCVSHIFNLLVNYNRKYNIPVLIIAYKDTSLTQVKNFCDTYKFPIMSFQDEKTIRSICYKIEDKKVPGILILKEGDIG